MVELKVREAKCVLCYQQESMSCILVVVGNMQEQEDG